MTIMSTLQARCLGDATRRCLRESWIQCSEARSGLTDTDLGVLDLDYTWSQGSR